MRGRSSAENVGEQILKNGKKIAKSSQQIVPKMSAHLPPLPFAPQTQTISSRFAYTRAAQEAAARRSFAELMAGDTFSTPMMHSQQESVSGAYGHCTHTNTRATQTRTHNNTCDCCFLTSLPKLLRVRAGLSLSLSLFILMCMYMYMYMYMHMYM